MKKILVIGTGGTIASVHSEIGLRPAYNAEELIAFFPEIKNIADIEGKMLFNIDSTNMQPHHWSEIAKEIEKQYNNYDGFVITHGTDTMQYTSAALSLMLQNLSKPVILTGSVKAVGEYGSDAKQNFIDSIIVACSNICDVCIVFHGKIIKGCKARKITNEATKITNQNHDVYTSINYHLIGEVIGTLKDNGTRKILLFKGYKPVDKYSLRELKVFPKIDDANVYLIKIYPGFKPEFLDYMKDSKYIILEVFGPGNIPFMENSIIEKIDIFTRKNVLIFITTQNPFGEVDMTLYEVGQRAMRAGAIPCNDMTSEMAIVKLMWTVGNFGGDSKTVKDIMLKNIAGEIR